jgi:tRNA(Ile)-lysidine synthase
LAELLGFEFVEREVRVRESGKNLEGAAREARYAALEEMARSCGVRFVAVAHHADDQIETVVMSLLRGTGGGVRGMAAKRKMRGKGVWLIRPMLTEGGDVDREACRGLCGEVGVVWREDATNGDVSRLRAAVRKHVVPVMREIRPRLGRRAMAAAEHARGVERLVGTLAEGVLARGAGHEGWEWDRTELRAEQPVVVGAAFRLARKRLCGPRGQDRIGKRAVDGVVRAIGDRSTEPRRFAVGGVLVEVTARKVSVRKAVPRGS